MDKFFITMMEDRARRSPEKNNNGVIRNKEIVVFTFLSHSLFTKSIMLVDMGETIKKS